MQVFLLFFSFLCSVLGSKIKDVFPICLNLFPHTICWFRITPRGIEVGKMLPVLSAREGKFNTNI